jgi:HD-like signal output (HDOD) protein
MLTSQDLPFAGPLMKNWINRLLAGAHAAGPAGGRQVNAPDHGAGAEIDAAYYRWLTASAGYAAPDDIQAAILGELASLAADPDAAARLVPRVPEVITQLLGKLNDDGASHGDLSRQVAQDLVLVAELIREANSAYYRPLTPVRTVEAAIMMLGQNGLRMLLARLAFRPLIRMQAHGFARRAAPHIWNQSEKCALAASLMAPGLSAAAFEAYLAGLMQNVGLVVAFRIADRICPDNQVPGARSFGAALQVHSRSVSAAVAAHWDFPPKVCAAIASAGMPDGMPLARALTLGDRIGKLRALIDGGVISGDDNLITEGLDAFQQRCLNKLAVDPA